MVLIVIGVLPGHKGGIGHHDRTHFIGQTLRADLRDHEPVMLTEPGVERLAQFRQPRAEPRLGHLCQDIGSVVPATSAASILRPETPMMSDAMVASLTPASSSTLFSRLTSEARSQISALRYHVRSRISRIS